MKLTSGQSESWDAGLQLLQLAEGARGTFSGRALSIGPVRLRKSLAVRMAEIASDTTAPVSIEGSSKEIYRRLLEMRNDTTKRLEDIGLVTMAYSLHNYALTGQDKDIVGFIRETFPHAELLLADYTLMGHSDDNILSAISSGFERETLERKGVEIFLLEHRVYTAEKLRILMSDQYSNITQHALSPFRSAFACKRMTQLVEEEGTTKELEMLASV